MKKRIISLFLCLFLMAALMPAALADGPAGQTGETVSVSLLSGPVREQGNSGSNGTSNRTEDEPKKQDEPDKPVRRDEYKLSASSANVSFYAKQGSSEVQTKSVTITNAGTRTAYISWSVLQSNDLISYEITGAGSVMPGGEATCAITFHADQAVPGNYNAALLFTDRNCPDDGSNVAVTITVTVEASQVPNVGGSAGSPGDEPPADAAEVSAGPLPAGIRAGAWYYDSFVWAAEKGVLMSGEAVDPAAPVSRALAVTMLWRLAGEPEGGEVSFADVDGGAAYAAAVGWAAENGIVGGTSGDTFGPDAPVTREQLAAILYRYAQTRGEGFRGMWAFPLDFPDAAEVSDYAFEPLCWLTMQGIILGRGSGRLAPGDSASAAEIVTVLMRYDTQRQQ